jgi:excisionase family DNA binding protein
MFIAAMTTHTPSPTTAGIVVIDTAQLKTVLRELLLETQAELIRTLPPAQQTEIRFYSRKEAAAKLGVSLPTLAKKMHSGKLQYKKLGKRVLFTEAHLSNMA